MANRHESCVALTTPCASNPLFISAVTEEHGMGQGQIMVLLILEQLQCERQ